MATRRLDRRADARAAARAAAIDETDRGEQKHLATLTETYRVHTAAMGANAQPISVDAVVSGGSFSRAAFPRSKSRPGHQQNRAVDPSRPEAKPAARPETKKDDAASKTGPALYNCADRGGVVFDGRIFSMSERRPISISATG
jgi:hypothetical protein